MNDERTLLALCGLEREYCSVETIEFAIRVFVLALRFRADTSNSSYKIVILIRS